jgi:hypothetical protein
MGELGTWLQSIMRTGRHVSEAFGKVSNAQGGALKKSRAWSIISITRGKKPGFVASLTEKPGFSPVEPQVTEKIQLGHRETQR